MTSLPLLLFAHAAKILPLSSIEDAVYRTATSISLWGMIYSEPFTESHKWTFG